MTASEDPWGDVPQVVNALSSEVIGVAIGVHRDIGPGISEAAYKIVLRDRLRLAGHDVAFEHPLPLVIDGVRHDKVYVADLVVDGVLLIEAKAVREISWPMIKQTKTYLRLGGYPLGLLLNFHAPLLGVGGIKRVVP